MTDEQSDQEDGVTRAPQTYDVALSESVSPAVLSGPGEQAETHRPYGDRVAIIGLPSEQRCPACASNLMDASEPVAGRICPQCGWTDADEGNPST